MQHSSAWCSGLKSRFWAENGARRGHRAVCSREASRSFFLPLKTPWICKKLVRTLVIFYCTKSAQCSVQHSGMTQHCLSQTADSVGCWGRPVPARYAWGTLFKGSLLFCWASWSIQSQVGGGRWEFWVLESCHATMEREKVRMLGRKSSALIPVVSWFHFLSRWGSHVDQPWQLWGPCIPALPGRMWKNGQKMVNSVPHTPEGKVEHVWIYPNTWHEAGVNILVSVSWKNYLLNEWQARKTREG